MNYAALISSVGSVTIGALSAASGNKRAWTALNAQADLMQQQTDFESDLYVTQNYQDFYLKQTEAQQAKAKVKMYTNVVGVGVIGLTAVGLFYVINKVI